ncbi:MAG: TrkH family potassium uptake protein [Sphingobacteriia bacterium]|nr:TrkH family potassium uptake protein [Sphingobacteriia bacterium]
MTSTFNWRQLFKTLGILLITESVFILLSACVSAIYDEYDLKYLLIAAAAACGCGGCAFLLTKNADRTIGKREGYTIVGVVWVVFSFFGMLPFWLSNAIPSVSDAFFETMSGFTTTGASILNDVEALPHGLLFWRSLIQWLGGMGIVMLSLAVLPFLRGGNQLFMAEVPGPTYDKLQPRIKNTARRLWGIYLCLTLLETALLYFGGMGLFDAMCHALTTMATGGYSTKQASIAYWDSPFIHYTIIVFMFIAGINFSLLYYSLVKHNFKKLFRDEEFRFYALFVAGATLLIFVSLILSHPVEWGIAETFRHSLFQTVSIITTTGYATADYMLWQPIAWMTLLFLMLMGASAGSTSGGIKIVRITVLLKNAIYEFKRLIHPKAILPIRMNGHLVSENVVDNIFAFTTFYLIFIVASIFVLLFAGMGIEESVGAVVTSISNVGPGLGSLGPMGTFSAIPDVCKWYLSFVMLVGRLELFTIFLLFSPSFWRK